MNLTIENVFRQLIREELEFLKEGLQLKEPKEQNPITSNLIDNDDFCSITGYTKSTTAQIRHKGEISYMRVGRKIFYKLEDVEKFLESKKKLSRQEIKENAVKSQKLK